MVKVVFVIALLGLIAVQVECLKCYSCENCDEEKDSKECTKEGLPESPQSILLKSTTTTQDSADASSTTTQDSADASSTTTQDSADVSSTTTQNPSDISSTTTVDPSTLKCFKLVIKDGDSTKVNRGCTARSCDNFKTQYGDKYEECGICNNEDDCNPASNVKSWAFSSVILVAIMKMFL